MTPRGCCSHVWAPQMNRVLQNQPAFKTRVSSFCNDVAPIQPITLERCFLQPDKEESSQISLGDELFSSALSSRCISCYCTGQRTQSPHATWRKGMQIQAAETERREQLSAANFKLICPPTMAVMFWKQRFPVRLTEQAGPLCLPLHSPEQTGAVLLNISDYRSRNTIDSHLDRCTSTERKPARRR